MGYYAEEKENGGGTSGSRTLPSSRELTVGAPEAALEGGVRGRFQEEEPKLGHFYF